jgi:hypothetical protein
MVEVSSNHSLRIGKNGNGRKEIRVMAKIGETVPLRRLNRDKRAAFQPNPTKSRYFFTRALPPRRGGPKTPFLPNEAIVLDRSTIDFNVLALGMVNGEWKATHGKTANGEKSGRTGRMALNPTSQSQSRQNNDVFFPGIQESRLVKGWKVPERAEIYKGAGQISGTPLSGSFPGRSSTSRRMEREGDAKNSSCASWEFQRLFCSGRASKALI